MYPSSDAPASGLAVMLMAPISKVPVALLPPVCGSHSDCFSGHGTPDRNGTGFVS